ncbi:MAG: GDP-mannose 4,6-dehydratase [Verrucomicrobiota bacterium]|nr:GDP-mannose 4,6-dehydratase [Verrucomicrobiota bacterium]
MLPPLPTSASRLLLTGAAGFIGSQVCEQLLAAGQPVYGIDNLNDYYDPRIKHQRIAHLTATYPHFQFSPLDIEDRAAINTLFATYHFTAVLNLAARAGVRYSLENPHVYLTTNGIGTLNLLEAMRAHGVKKFVLASTSSLYEGQPMPFVETAPVNEPISPYAASKKAAEALAYTYHRQFSLDVSIVRYFTVYGPASRPDMAVFRFIEWIIRGQPVKILGDGTQSRDFTYVDDIASGTIAALKPLGYEIINLGGGQNPISLNQLISTLETLIGKKANCHYGTAHSADFKTNWADISKAARLLNWHPKISLTEGLTRSVTWHLQNRELLERCTF